MADVNALRAERAQLRPAILELERQLGDESRKQGYQDFHGVSVGIKRYEQWRNGRVELLGKLKFRDEQLKAQIEDSIRTDGAVELLREFWELLEGDDDYADLRERIRVFVRDSYGVFFKNQKGVVKE